MSVEEFRNCIAGEWAASLTGRTFENTNPADVRDVVGRFQASSADDAKAAVDAAAAAFAGWRATPVTKRAKVLLAAADHIEANADRFALELTREEGKQLALAKDEFLRSAQTLRFYAIEGQSFTGETYPQDDPDMVVYSQREPLGVVTVISPWNFPVSIPARKIAPALITGNTVVFKPSSDAPLSGYRLAEALRRRRPAEGRAQLHHRPRRRRRPDADRVSRGARDLVHRLDPRRRADPPRGRADDAHADGARRQEPADRHGRRRPRPGRRSRGQGRPVAERPGLHRHQPHPGDARGPGGVHARSCWRACRRSRSAAASTRAPTSARWPRPAQLDNVLSYVGHRQERGNPSRRRRPAASRAICSHGYFVSPAVFTDVTQTHAHRPAKRSSARCWRSSRSRATTTRSPRRTTRRTASRRRSRRAIRATCIASPTTSRPAR